MRDGSLTSFSFFMKLLLLGATGHTGRELLDIALAHGHDVTVLVRSPEKLGPTRARVVQGDVLDANALARAMAGQDAVLSALGPRAREALRAGSSLMASSSRATIAAMKQAGVSRVGVVSAAVLFPEKGLRFAFARFFLRHHAHDLAAMESAFTASGLDFVFARPPRLVSSRDDAYRAERDALPRGASAMSFRAVASFLVDALERGQFSRAVVGLAAPA
jgi:putative NADH-flavin reductase